MLRYFYISEADQLQTSPVSLFDINISKFLNLKKSSNLIIYYDKEAIISFITIASKVAKLSIRKSKNTL